MEKKLRKLFKDATEQAILHLNHYKGIIDEDEAVYAQVEFNIWAGSVGDVKVSRSEELKKRKDKSRAKQ